MEEYFSAINDAIERYNVDYLIPCYDEAIFLAENRKYLIRPNVFKGPSAAAYWTLHHKPSLMEMAKNLGCSAPNTFLVRNDSDLLSIASQLGFPLIAKPERGGGGWGVRVISSSAELESVWRSFGTLDDGNRLFLQAFVKGHVIGHGTLCRKGEVIACDTYKIVRQYPPVTGTATYRVSVASAEIARQAETLLGYVKWDGPCHFDFIVDEETGVAFLIDCNPRFWGSIAHAAASGVDVPGLYLASLRGQVAVMAGTRGNGLARSVWLWGDLLHMITMVRSGTLTVAGAARELWGLVGAKVDDWSWVDPLPFWVYPIAKILTYKKERPGF